MQPVDYSYARPTRDALQDACKILGKIQQLFIPATAHDEQHGLVIAEHGITTQFFEIGHQEWRLVLNVAEGQIIAGKDSWPLAGKTGAELYEILSLWLGEQGFTGTIPMPEFSGDYPDFDETQARAWWSLLSWSHVQLMQARSYLASSQTSPVLLYPHHFDDSFSWFYEPDSQYTIGLSTGDQTIAEPYFYITQHPETTKFKDRLLPSPARWQNEGFSGAVVTHRHLTTVPEAEAWLQEFIKTAIQT